MNKRRRFKAKRRRRDAWVLQLASARLTSWGFWATVERLQPSWYDPSRRPIEES